LFDVRGPAGSWVRGASLLGQPHSIMKTSEADEGKNFRFEIETQVFKKKRQFYRSQRLQGIQI